MHFHSAPRRLAGAIGLATVAAGCSDNVGLTSDPNELDNNVRIVTAMKSISMAPDTVEQDGWFIKFRDGAVARAAASAADVSVAYELPNVNGIVTYDDPKAFEGDPNVEGIYMNTKYYKQFASTATFFRRGWQWDMIQMRANLVPSSVNGAGVRVCVIDGGVANVHQDLTGKVVANAAFTGGGSWGALDDADSHGSHVGSAVSSNGVGMASVADGAQLMNANVFGPNAGTSVAQVTDAMAWCTANGADVINMSLGGSRTRGTAAWVSDSTAYTNATISARAAGVVVVAAAGNSNTAIPGTGASQAFLPAEATGVMTVGATAPNSALAFPFAPAPPGASFDTKASYTNFNTGNDALGPGVRIYAPGGANILRNALNTTGVCNPVATDFAGACAGGRSYIFYSGTSMASPRAAGVVALITQRYLGQAKNLLRAQRIEACLLQTSDALPAGTPFFARGRVNALRAATEACPGLGGS
jgi:subtilisin family serine protease